MKLALAAALLLGLMGCLKPDRWEGIAYPNKHNLSTFLRLGEWPTLEACRAGTVEVITKLGWTNSGTYECGLNCRPFADDMKMCEKTLK